VGVCKSVWLIERKHFGFGGKVLFPPERDVVTTTVELEKGKANGMRNILEGWCYGKNHPPRVYSV
jgi:hypothetical protein